MDIRVENWGLIRYIDAHHEQIKRVEELINGYGKESIIICRHHPVVTLGKQATEQDLTGWSGEIHKVERGGKATYHGPKQIIIYPILDLKNRGQNIGGLLQLLQNVLVGLLSEQGLSARGTPSYAGVWVRDETQNNERKVASIGLAVKKWITYHGLALNLAHDPLAFKGIASCGLESNLMTYMEEQTRVKVNRENLELQLVDRLQNSLKTDHPIQVATR